MGLSQLFISYKQNQSILLWRPTFNLKSGVLASATWLRERHDMRSMYIVALMTSVKRSWPQERLVLKLSIIEQTHGNIVFYIIKKQTTTENLFFFFFLFQTLSTWLPESSSNTSPKWRPKWRLPCWFRHVGSTKTLLCACSRVSQAFLPPVIVAFSNLSGVMWTENILSVF